MVSITPDEVDFPCKTCYHVVIGPHVFALPDPFCLVGCWGGEGGEPVGAAHSDVSVYGSDLKRFSSTGATDTALKLSTSH